ncbi:MAG: cellobiose phosphorylase, partial [Candidatus Omnitrophica bacterium]|nr:cellobiose phosphorylase [Candidatus Omnitrophota bacterium]
MEMEIIDGLPQITPFGMTEWHSKHMSRTIEAWMQVLNMDKNAPFYKLKVNPQDTPELEYIERGNFYLAYIESGKKNKLLRPIVDPDLVFGPDGDLSYPRIFAESGNFNIPQKQKKEGKTPSAFSYARVNIKPANSKEIISIMGHVKDLKSLNLLLPRVSRKGYFSAKLNEGRKVIDALSNSAFTKSSSANFDFYCRSTFLDNLLRGGFPVTINIAAQKTVFYAYARKHGDLERDYNAFLLEPSYYSQGNGAYRDMNQNRRNDTFFNTAVGDANILTFLNAIQPDGFNPHLMEGVTLFIKDRKALDGILKANIRNTADRNKTKQFLAKDFTPGSFVTFLEEKKVDTRRGEEALLKEVLSVSGKEDIVSPGEGYWVDHWTYNIDLFENYLALYPERLRNLLLERKFTFYDTYLKTNPRDEKYVYADGKVRQLGSVVEDEEKRRIIEHRPREQYKVRTRHGKGDVYKTSLLVKLLCIIANKMASLDPFGIGIEMEAGKPGWCDSLNNLPGVFGSSLCETFELKRLIGFLHASFRDLDLSSEYNISFPREISDFMIHLHRLVNKNLSSRSKNADFEYWDYSWQRKEEYRRRVWYGFEGREALLSIAEIKVILDSFLRKIESGLKKGFSKKDKLTHTYYINEVTRFEFIKKGGKPKLNKNGLPNIKALAFRHNPLPLFLEGPVHALRVQENIKDVKALYRAVKMSGLYDRKLKMYKINAPLKGMPDDIGRSTIFTPGWLENESIWLHMEYKYLLELLRKGLYEEFFSDFKNCLVAFQDPHRYGRSILENSSFLVSSAYPDESLHGNGFVARLTGSTTEFLTMWLFMCAGKRPFKVDEKKEVFFELKPVLPAWLFTKEGNRFPKDSFSFSFLGGTLIVYHNPKRRDTFSKNGVKAASYILRKKNGEEVVLKGNVIPSPVALEIRDGLYERIDVALS